MAVAKCHPKDGKLRFDYVSRKIEHLRAKGLIAANKAGYGQNVGACPDWLVTEQKAEEKRLDEAAIRARLRGQKQPDIEWFRERAV